MKILAVSELNLDVRDGSTTHFLELLTHLSKSNEVKALVPKAGKSSIRSELNIEYVRAFTPKYTDRSAKLFYIAKIIFFMSYQFFLFFKILNISKREKVDVIYSRQGMLSLSQLLASKITGEPLISEVNGILSEELKIVGVPVFFIKFLKRFEQMTLKGSKRVITVAEPIRNFLQADYHLNQPIHVIPNGANVELFRPLDKDSCKRELSLKYENQYVCYVGYLVPWQGVDYLIKAASLVLRKVPEARFLIVGDGSMKEELEGMVEDLKLDDHFIFTNSVPYEDVAKYINASDVCVAPFIRKRNEVTGLSPIKIYEYLACEKPVVASNIKGVGDFLTVIGIGIAVEPENKDDLAEGIIRFLCDDELRVDMGRRGREIMIEEFSWEKIVRSVEDVLKSITITQPKNI